MYFCIYQPFGALALVIKFQDNSHITIFDCHENFKEGSKPKIIQENFPY